MEVPLIALIAPIRLVAVDEPACGCALDPGSVDDAASGKLAPAANRKIHPIVNRVDVLVSLIRSSTNLHAPDAPQRLIYKVLPE
jgi:hypothetical protein